MDRSSRQKINKETEALNDTLDQMDIIDIYRAFHPKTIDFTFFLNYTWNILQETWNFLQNKVTNQAFISYKNIEIISSNFSGHNTVRLDINCKKKKKKKRKKTVKNRNICRLNNMLLNKQRSLKKSKRTLKNT